MRQIMITGTGPITVDDKRFITLAIEYESLQTELHRSCDPIMRSLLLFELWDKLAQIERTVKTVREELPEPPKFTTFSN
jgi:hypothetical protein